ncbi:MAG: BON domain-containing protein [Gammaproteobacteria bacterium]|nr:BON domain-containing protein [Gammaproteobacteria bacterium]
MRVSRISMILLGALLLSGCVATLVGAAAVTTIDVAHERRTVGAYIDDGAIELQIRQYMLRDTAVRQQTHLSATSMNGIVLVTGEARNPDIRNQVLDYARGVNGVRQAVDETEISGKTGLISRTNDSWLTTKVKTTLYAKTGFDANRVKVVTEHGTVYLMGLLTRAEASQAVDVVRHIKGVVRVVKVFEYVD